MAQKTFQAFQSKRIVIFIAVGLAAFLLYLYYYVGTGNFVDVVKGANVYYYVSAFVAFTVGTVFSAITWRGLLENLKVKTTIRRAVMFTWAGFFFDATLPEPGWSGDISKSYMLSKEADEDVGKVIASVVGQKIISMAVTILILILGFSILAINYAVPTSVLTFLAAVLAISVASFAVVYYLSVSAKATKAMVHFLATLASFFLRSRFNEKKFQADSENFLKIFHEGIAILNADRKALLRPILFYVVSVSFDVSVVFFTFAALGFPVPVDKVLIVYALTGTLASIGVSFVGLTEIIMTSAYQALLIPLAVSFSVTLLTRVVTLWFKLVIGYAAFQYTGLGILRGKKQSKPDEAGKFEGQSSAELAGP